MANNKVELPLVDLSSPDNVTTAKSIRQACLEYGFFYLIHHGIETEMLREVFGESNKFFGLPLSEKMEVEHNKGNIGYTPMYSDGLNPSSTSKGDLNESFFIGPPSEDKLVADQNRWPSEERLPSLRETMEAYHEKTLNVAKRLVNLVALALNLDEKFFEKIEGFYPAVGFLRLVHYPGRVAAADKGKYGSSAHSDFGMLTLLATDGVSGLQICREREREPQLWEDVHQVDGAFIVNVGDMLERWTNSVFRSTLHRVISVGKERYSVVFFLNPSFDCMIECIDSCCSEDSPPRFPPISCGDYLLGRFRDAYSKKN